MSDQPLDGAIWGFKRRVERVTFEEDGVTFDGGQITVPAAMAGKVVTIIWEVGNDE